MEPMEDVFRDGLRDAVSSQPTIAPIELEEVLARAEGRPVHRRSVGRWVGLAAAVTLAAGFGLWAVQSSARVSTEPRVAGSPAGGQLRTLRVLNDTGVGYRQAALQLADGRSLPLGDVPAGGTVLVPMDGTATAAAPIPIDTSGVASGLRVLYSGDCSTSDGQLIAIATDGGGITIQLVGAPAPGAADSSSVISATIVPASPSGAPSPSSVPDATSPAPEAGPTSAAASGSVPTCTITIAEAQPTPESTPS